jgi:hypothetical protein
MFPDRWLRGGMLHVLILAPLALLPAGCDGGDLGLPTEGLGKRVEMVDGDQQVGRPGARLPKALVVRLIDEANQPMPDRLVAWVVSAGGGEVRPVADSTDGGGIAAAEWTLGPEIGTHTVEAVVSRVGLVTFTATATEDGEPGLIIEKIEGDGQRAAAGAPVAIRPAVRVTDRDGDPVAGVEVTFEVTAGGGTVEGADQATNADGIARVDAWLLGPEPGVNTLEASGEALQGSPVVFSAEGTDGAGVARLIFLVEPDDPDVRERFRVEVALVDEGGDLVPLSGVLIYLGLFRNGNDTPSNQLLLGDRFSESSNGIAVFDDLGITEEGRYRLRALTDDLPGLGADGPEPPLFSDQFEVD